MIEIRFRLFVYPWIYSASMMGMLGFRYKPTPDAEETSSFWPARLLSGKLSTHSCSMSKKHFLSLSLKLHMYTIADHPVPSSMNHLQEETKEHEDKLACNSLSKEFLMPINSDAVKAGITLLGLRQRIINELGVFWCWVCYEDKVKLTHLVVLTPNLMNWHHVGFDDLAFIFVDLVY